MLRTMLKSKIHRARVTQADLHYVGSVTIDADLMDAADLLEGEQVTIVAKDMLDVQTLLLHAAHELCRLQLQCVIAESGQLLPLCNGVACCH